MISPTWRTSSVPDDFGHHIRPVLGVVLQHGASAENNKNAILFSTPFSWNHILQWSHKAQLRATIVPCSFHSCRTTTSLLQLWYNTVIFKEVVILQWYPSKTDTILHQHCSIGALRHYYSTITSHFLLGSSSSVVFYPSLLPPKHNLYIVVPLSHHLLRYRCNTVTLLIQYDDSISTERFQYLRHCATTIAVLQHCCSTEKFLL